MSGALVISAMLCAAAGSFSDERAPSRALVGILQLKLDAPRTIGTAPGDLALRTSRQGGSDEPEPPPPADRTNGLRSWERALKWSTAGALVATSALGTMAAMNQPTAFGDGRCLTGDPVLGTYGCDRGLSTLHGISGVLSLTLYTADTALAFAIPGPEGNVSESERPWHRALTYVHLGGITLQPLLGLISAFPAVVGQSDATPTDPFPRNMRTAHVCLGYVTLAAFLATLALEL